MLLSLVQPLQSPQVAPHLYRLQSWEVETVTEGTVMEEVEAVTGAGEMEVAVVRVEFQ